MDMAIRRWIMLISIGVHNAYALDVSKTRYNLQILTTNTETEPAISKKYILSPSMPRGRDIFASWKAGYPHPFHVII